MNLQEAETELAGVMQRFHYENPDDAALGVVLKEYERLKKRADEMDRLAAHLLVQRHPTQFKLTVNDNDTPGGSKVWMAEVTNDTGSFYCTALTPQEALESLLKEVKT